MDGKIEMFPKNPYEAIAMVYVEKAIASGCTPEDAIKVYWETLKKSGEAKI